MNPFDLPPRRYDYDEIAAWPDEARRELDDGTPITLYAPGFCPVIAHSRCVSALLMALGDCKKPENAEIILLVDWQIDNWNSVTPDLCFFETAPKVRADGQCLIAAPDLTVEVLDERTFENDTVRKPALYARQKVSLLWLVDPEKQIVLVHQNPTSNGYRSIWQLSAQDALTCSLLSDFKLPLDRLFGF